MKETEIARPVVQWLREKGWTVYQEVRIYDGGDRADIIADKDGKIWAIESKPSLCFAVIEQAWHWKRFSNMCSVAVPGGHGKGRSLAFQVCKDYGVGILEVDLGVYERMVPEVRTTGVATETVRKALHPGMQDYAEAGNADGKFWSPFKHTLQQLIKVAEEEPGIDFLKAIEKIEHHYGSDKSAKATLTQWIRKGTIKELELRWEGRSSKLFPKVEKEK